MKNTILTVTIFMTIFSATSHAWSNKQNQYVPLCVDLARRVVTDKAAFFHHYNKQKRHTASKVGFSKFPQVVNQKTDLAILKLLISSSKTKKLAKNFTQKLDAEDQLIKRLSTLLTREAKPFIGSCVSLYQNVENKCNAYMAKDFNKYTACLSAFTSDTAPYVAKFIPYLSYKQKMRTVASVQKR